MGRIYRYAVFGWFGLVMAIGLVLPSQAAERLYLRYAPFGFTIPVPALVTFAETGKAPEIEFFLKFLKPQQRSQLQQVLQATYELDAKVVSQFSYTASGEQLLQEIGDLLRTAAGQNGFYSLRAAAILTAADAQVSVLNFLKHLPTDMQIDLRQVMAWQRQLAELLQETAEITATIAQKSARAAQLPLPLPDDTADGLAQVDLRQPGSIDFTSQSLTWTDPSRDRRLTFDLYRPKLSTPAPVILISNGLGAKRDRFTDLASHLASHGFAVVVPDHPGSDRERLRGFYQGLYRENFAAAEFVDRPLDMTFLLNQLERLNSTELNQSFNLNQVGIFGYSFGGTTALSLGGAEIQSATLETACQSQPAIFNISLLYQCRALSLPPSPPLRDGRVKAIYAFVPFGRSLFGAGLKNVAVPVLWEASNEDVLTPLPIEQTPAFEALTSPDKYFVLAQGLPHARINHEIISRLTQTQRNWDDLKAIAERYHNALSVAFFKTYVAQDDRYRPFLSATYAAKISEKPYSLNLVDSVKISAFYLLSRHLRHNSIEVPIQPWR